MVKTFNRIENLVDRDSFNFIEWLAVVDHHEGGLGVLPVSRRALGHGKGEGLGHVGEALLLHHAFDGSLVKTQLVAEGVHVLGWGHGNVVLNAVSVAGLALGNLPRAISVALAVVLLHHRLGAILQGGDSAFTHGAASIDSDDQP